ncbi:MAG: hypothetical protein U0105_15640 [Candidatus Obscuribacterales bacterium]
MFHKASIVSSSNSKTCTACGSCEESNDKFCVTCGARLIAALIPSESITFYEERPQGTQVGTMRAFVVDQAVITDENTRKIDLQR